MENEGMLRPLLRIVMGVRNNDIIGRLMGNLLGEERRIQHYGN